MIAIQFEKGNTDLVISYFYERISESITHYILELYEKYIGGLVSEKDIGMGFLNVILTRESVSLVVSDRRLKLHKNAWVLGISSERLPT